MYNKDLLISIFEKEIGRLTCKRETLYGDSSTYELEFVYKTGITVKILLIESTPNNWFISHELSKENPFLLKKIAYSCMRIQRIKENMKTSIKLSDDLLDIQGEMFIKTAVKSIVQNFINLCFLLFSQEKEDTRTAHYNGGMRRMNVNL